MKLVKHQFYEECKELLTIGQPRPHAQKGYIRIQGTVFYDVQ